uniref:NodB homology domain-containing protein n=1 Tax=Candidatus Protofrankia californiensis TaxID=1839754 RepID=A0A1W1B821_9ACTN|nr:hypothetical protein FDG2_6007 [Candidatus Protofrankia californiensis]
MTRAHPAPNTVGDEPGARRIVLAFAFDDGPDPGYTLLILDLFAEHEVLAISCVVGRHAAAHLEIISRMVASGHLLAGHSMTHRSLSRCDEQRTRWEIREARRAPLTATRVLSPVFRCWRRWPGRRHTDGIQLVRAPACEAAATDNQTAARTRSDRSESMPATDELLNEME